MKSRNVSRDNVNLREGPELSRRHLLQATAVTLIASPAIWTSQARAAQTITVTSWGGAYRKGVEDVFAGPFTKETGIGVTLVDNADLAKVKAQVLTKNVQWDVFDSIGPHMTAGTKEELWEEVDEKIIDRSALIVKGSHDYVAMYSFAGVIAWDSKRFPEGKHPTDFKGFWDAGQFPGRRCLRVRATETLEMALIADGVEPRQLYPLDVDRAFRALDRVKPLVRKWAETTPETISLVVSGETDFSYTYMGRVVAAQESGATVDCAFGQTINSYEYYAVPKGSKNKEAAMRYIAFCLRPDRQAAYADAISCAPNTQKGFELLSSKARKFMPDMQSPQNAILDDSWWASNFESLQKRYTEWLVT